MKIYEGVVTIAVSTPRDLVEMDDLMYKQALSAGQRVGAMEVGRYYTRSSPQDSMTVRTYKMWRWDLEEYAEVPEEWTLVEVFC